MGKNGPLHDIFGPGSNINRRFVSDLDELAQRVAHLRGLELTIVLTSGAFDFKHVGHERYLECAKEHGDVLIVGLDSDERVRERKKDANRPIVPQEERIEQLCHSRHVDLVALKHKDDPRWHLIKTVKPDVLIVSDRNHRTLEEMEALKEFCGQVVQLETQADTSTTSKIHKLVMGTWMEARGLLGRVIERLHEATEAADQARTEIDGKINHSGGGTS